MLEFPAGGQQHCLQAGPESPVNQGHLVLVIEIRHAADAPDNHAGLMGGGELSQKPRPEFSIYVRQVGHSCPDHFQLLVRQKHRAGFLGVGADADPDFVEASGGAANDIQMPQGNGVKAAGANRCSHDSFLVLLNSAVKRRRDFSIAVGLCG